MGFRSLTEVIDAISAGDKLVFYIFGALAELKHSLTRERTLAGLVTARARSQGGRRPVMWRAERAQGCCVNAHWSQYHQDGGSPELWCQPRDAERFPVARGGWPKCESSRA